MTEKSIYDICLEPECNDPEPPKEMPSVFEMAKNFIQSGKDIVGGVMAGEGLLVSEEVFNTRMKICSECPLFEAHHKRCSECGCFMEAKSTFKKTYCPVGKWNAEV